MNNWSDIRKLAIVESDDFQDKYDRSGLNFLFYWKAKYPNFKITLFTIPNRTTPEFKRLIDQLPWIELAVHGYDHESNFECYGWNYETAKGIMQRTQSARTWKDKPYINMFKAPGWTITPDLCGYPAAPEDPIQEDKQAVYKAMKDLDIIVVDRHYNKERRVDGKYICIDCNPDIVHMHTWNMMTPNQNERNGFEQVEQLHGVPWDNNTEFLFMSEAYEKGIIKACQD